MFMINNQLENIVFDDHTIIPASNKNQLTTELYNFLFNKTIKLTRYCGLLS